MEVTSLPCVRTCELGLAQLKSRVDVDFPIDLEEIIDRADGLKRHNFLPC